MIAEVIQGGSKSGHVDGQGEEEALDSRGIVRVAESETLQEHEVPKKRLRMAQLDDAKQGNDVDADLREHIEAQLLTTSPILKSRLTALHRAAQQGHEEVVARLLTTCPFLINEPEKGTGLTALHLAAQQGHMAIVTQLLAVNPGLIDARTNEGWAALHLAARNGQAEVVALILVAHPAAIEARTGAGWTALHLAAFFGHAAVVKQFWAVSPALITARTNEGDTALHLAILTGHTAIVAQLLDMNSDLIDARTNASRTALHLAVEKGEKEAVALILDANPAATEARTNDGRTALHLAAQSNQEIVTQLLAANPALIEARANNGQTVLHCAFKGEEITIATQLLAAKPNLIEAIINDVDSWTALLNVIKIDHEEAVARLLTIHPQLIHQTSRGRGWTVFHEAAFFGSNKVVSRLLATVTQSDLEQLLLRRSTGHLTVNEGTNEGSTALHVAARTGNSNIVAQLLAACPSLVDVLDSVGQTCLHSVIKLRESESAMEVLFAFKPALAHAVDAFDNTVLHFLSRSQQNSSELIEKVWKMNPDALHARNWGGKTPFQFAVECRNDRFIDLLQWSVTFDEIVSAYNMCGRSYGEKLKPLMALQCEELAVELLPDVVAIVFEYLGFERGLLPRENPKSAGSPLD